MEPYYYQTLSKAEQSSYQAMQAGLQAFAPSFPVPLLENRALTDVFMKLRLDCPQLFYAGTFQYRYYPDSRNAELIPAYLFEKGKMKEHQKALQSRVEKLVRPVARCSDEEKLLYIHDFICKNVRYDKLKKPYSHEIIGPLTQGVGVCEGIAKTVKALCDAAGVECIIALSEANPEKGVRYRHTWNVLTIDGKRYHMDATFDNSLQRGTHRYDYFNLDDKHIFSDHEKLVLPVPKCTEDKGYYYRSVSLTKTEDVANRVCQALRKKQTQFVFHWRGGGLNREILNEILAGAAEEAGKKGLQVSCAVNVRQAVIQLDFGTTRETELQQPDEGQEDAQA